MLISCKTVTKKPEKEKYKTQSTELAEAQNPQEKPQQDSTDKNPTFSPPVENAAFVEEEETSTSDSKKNKLSENKINPKNLYNKNQQPQTSSKNSSRKKTLSSNKTTTPNMNDSGARSFAPASAKESSSKGEVQGISVRIGSSQGGENPKNIIMIKETQEKRGGLEEPDTGEGSINNAQILSASGGSGMLDPSSGNALSNEGSTYGAPDRFTETEPKDQNPLKNDDDIVARQIREAAESEDNAELSEKLWNEYKRYKADL